MRNKKLVKIAGRKGLSIGVDHERIKLKRKSFENEF